MLLCPRGRGSLALQGVSPGATEPQSHGRRPGGQEDSTSFICPISRDEGSSWGEEMAVVPVNI